MSILPAEIAAARAKIMSDLVSKLQPASPVQKAADPLANLVPGQRFMATIQSLLPDGTYRAHVAGRPVTLALPFAAAAGETLELEAVVEQNGKTTLAVVTGRDTTSGQGEAGNTETNTSVATRLTPTGKLIAELLSSGGKEGSPRAEPAPLSQARPLFAAMTGKAADLAPILKEALAKSGMFYEAHQARWIEGKGSLAALLSEPQGRFSPALQALLARERGETTTARAPSLSTARPEEGVSAKTLTATPTAIGDKAAAHQQTATSAHAASNVTARATEGEIVTKNTAANNATTQTGGAVRVGMGQAVATELAPLVRQQLEALASNTYVWQGQIWPGQVMNWEIVEEDGEQGRQEDNEASRWVTRLRLKLPRLGQLEATLKFTGGRNIEIFLQTEDDAARARLMADNAGLRRGFETSGLALTLLNIARHAQPPA
jgi:hypothetical protein